MYYYYYYYYSKISIIRERHYYYYYYYYYYYLKGRPKIIEKDTGQRLQGTKKIELREKESKGKENRAQQQQLIIG